MHNVIVSVISNERVLMSNSVNTKESRATVTSPYWEDDRLMEVDSAVVSAEFTGPDDKVPLETNSIVVSVEAVVWEAEGPEEVDLVVVYIEVID